MELPIPVLKGVECFRHDPIEEWKPTDDTEVDYELTLEIGPSDSEGADLYMVRVLTPQAISRHNLGRDLASAQTKHLVISPYCWTSVVAMITEILETCQGDSYQAQTEFLKNHFQWEGDY